MYFTGIKDLDLLILEKLNDRDLGKTSSLNSYFRELCTNDNFWRKKTEKRFNKYLYPLLEDYKYAYSKTWKEYYIYLLKFLNKIAENNRWGTNREDTSRLLKIREENMSKLEIELLENFYNYKWKDILKEDLIYSNVYRYFQDLNYGENCTFFLYLSKLENTKINPNKILYSLLDSTSTMSEEEEKEYEKLAELLLKNPKINVYEIIDILDFQDPNIYVLEVYFEYIRNQGKVEDLLDRSINFEEESAVDRINNYFAKEIKEIKGEKSVLPEILSSLKKYNEEEYRKILRFMKRL